MVVYIKLFVYKKTCYLNKCFIFKMCFYNNVVLYIKKNTIGSFTCDCFEGKENAYGYPG